MTKVIDTMEKKMKKALARGRVPLALPGTLTPDNQIATRIVKLKPRLQEINNLMEEISK